MKTYTSCFIGITLPQKYQEKFEQLLLTIKTIDATIETVQPKTPHITLYYLNKKSQYSLEEIMTLIKPELNVLQNSLLTVGGFDYFNKDDPKVLFLQVTYPATLSVFNNILSKRVSPYGDIDNMHVFHPHVTIGRIRNNSAKESFIKNKAKLHAQLNAIKWEFPVNEIAIYGVDSYTSPQYQKKLAVIHLPKS